MHSEPGAFVNSIMIILIKSAQLGPVSAQLEPINPRSRLSVKVRDGYDDDQLFVDSVDQGVWEAD